MTRRITRRTVLGGTAGALATVPAVTVGRRTQDDDSEDEGDESDDGAGGSDEGEAGEPEIVADFEPPDLPENLAIDDEGNLYASMAPTGEIRRIAPDGSESSVGTVDVGDGFLLGVAYHDGAIYAAAASGEEDTHGVWRVGLEGDAERAASLPAEETMPNGIVPARDESDALLVSDHLGGAVWRVTDDGAEPWFDSPLLDPSPYAETAVGADGVAFHPDGDFFVNNLNFGGIVRVPVDDGTAGEPEVYLQDDALVGCDGMTFDEEGSLYVAVNAANEVVRITPDREIETLASGGDLDFPADVLFGPAENGSAPLYVCNFAFGSFLAEEAEANPSLMRLDVEATGASSD